MAILLVRGRVGSLSAYKAMEMQGVPAWYPDRYHDKGTWWRGGGDGYGFYWSIVGNHGFIQYGRNFSGWATCRFYDETITWVNEVQNSDGSVSCDVTVDIGNFRGDRTDYYRGGIAVNSNIQIGNTTVYTHNGSSGDVLNDRPSKPRVTKHITIPPQSYSDDIQMYFNAHYPSGMYPDAHYMLGMTLYNPTPPAYIPMAARKGGNWQSFNDHNGHILIRHGNNWDNKSKELYTTQRQANHGHNRIRRGGQWLQLPKM